MSALVLCPYKVCHQARAGARAVNLGGPNVYQGGPKFEIKHKVAVFKRESLWNGGQACRLGGGSGSSLAPSLHQAIYRAYCSFAHVISCTLAEK